MTLGAQQPPVRDAATLVLLRDGPRGASVLMGRRAAGAAFMPSKYVFPGGALDGCDAAAGALAGLDGARAGRFGPGAAALAACAIRELWEETGLVLGRAAPWPDPPEGWRGFAATGHRPDASALAALCRAVTPPGRSRRFDARFFVAPAAALAGDIDDFSRAGDELSDLHWVPLSRAHALDLPAITRLALREAEAWRAVAGAGDRPLPVFHGTAPAARDGG